MMNRDDRAEDAADLRRKAETLARPPEDGAVLLPEEIRETLHELRVHQIELEIQNEELREAQAEIEAGRARYFDLYDLAPVGYCTLSEQGLIVEANLTAATLLGAARGALVRQPISRFIFMEDQDIYYLHRKQLFEAGAPLECELRLVKPDGTMIWAHLKGIAAHAEDGAPVCRMVLGDITEHKRAEEEKLKLQAQLAQAQKMESVGRLAGGVAHDFNNMLTIILGHAEMVLDEIGPADPHHVDLEEIRKAARRSADLTRQLLAFARKQTIAPKVLDLNETVEGMLKMLRRLIGENIDLAWKPGRDLWPVRLDPAQIDQMLANLCVNARDAIAYVGRITIETNNVAFDEDDCARHAGLNPGCYVLLAVSDDGCGMDDETLSHLFEPFFTTKGVGEGTGLGLATIYGAVKQNNGFINVYSEPGQGTTFKIYLPRHATRTEPLPESAQARTVVRGHETILLVEDEPQILRMITMILERQGYAVLAANTPGEAIRMAKEHPGRIDLLLTDVVMPEMNGRDLAESLISLHPDIKRLFISGYTAHFIAHSGVLDEDVHFIQKPFSKNDLGAKLREVLEQ